MKCPDEKIKYSVICKKFPEPNIYFDTVDEAISWAKGDQPAYRPYYIVECVEHYEICGCVDDKGEEKEMKNENKTYEQGLTDAWDAAKKLICEYSITKTREILCNEKITRAGNIFDNYTAAEAIAKIKAYEEEQQKIEQEIKVGDELEFNSLCAKKTIKGVVYQINYADDVYSLWTPQDKSIGGTFTLSSSDFFIKKVKKTGRYFPQVEELLKAMKEGQ